MVSRDVSISTFGLLYLKYELSYLPVVMETLFSKLHDVLHNPIIAKAMKSNSNIRERFKLFIITMFLMQNYLTLTNRRSDRWYLQMPRLRARNFRQARNRIRHAQNFRDRKVICSVITHNA